MEQDTSSQPAAVSREAGRRCLVYDIGRRGYLETLDFQHRLHSSCRSGLAPHALVLVEHDPVITLGVKADPQNLLFPLKQLEADGIEVVQTDRGGDVTYHGPGQIVGYPILNLKQLGADVHRYVRLLEEVVIQTLADFGVDGTRNGPAGVWAGGKKLCSIGIAVRGWVTYHGFALNVSPLLDHFGYINPCGLASGQISSLERLLGRTVEVSEVKPRLLEHFSELFGLDMEKGQG